GPGRPGRAGGGTARRDHEGCREDRLDEQDHCRGGQAGRQPCLRDDPRGGAALRAERLLRAVRHGRPEGGHGRLRREAQARVAALTGGPDTGGEVAHPGVGRAPGDPLPVLTLTGYLGAGKTTLLNHLLSGAPGLRIAAVVNDFGDIDVDAGAVAGQVDSMVSMPNGCVCCEVDASELGEAMEKLAGP